MKSFFTKMWEQLKKFFGGLTRAARIRLAVLAIVVVGLSIGIVALLNHKTYDVLYDSLDNAQTLTVTNQLQEMNVDWYADGKKIMVPSSEVGQLRLLVGNGISGDFDYSLLKNASGFGVTQAEQEAWMKLQLAEHIKESIMKSDLIKDCTVILNLPKSTSFVLQQNKQQPTASVTVQTEDGAQLTQDQANAIINSVYGAATIPPENVKLTDWSLREYSYKVVDGSIPSIAEQQTLTLELQEQLEQKALGLLAPVYKMANLKAAVNVVLNFDDVSKDIVELEPPVPGNEDGVVISFKEQWNYITNEAAGGVPGTDANGAGTGIPEYPYFDENAEAYYYNWIKEYNYDYNTTHTKIQQAKGGITALNISMTINSKDLAFNDKAVLTALVANALGIEQEYVIIDFLPFAEPDTQVVGDPAQDSALQRLFIKNIIEQVIIALIILIIILAFLSLIRALIKGVSQAGQPQAVLADGTGMNVDYLAGFGEGTEAELNPESAYPDVDLNAKSEGVEQLERFIERDPQAVAQLLRNWLTED